MTTGRPAAAASVSTHILDTAAGHPAAGVPVRVSVRGGEDTAGAPDGGWTGLGSSATDADGRCRDLPAAPPGTTGIRLDFETGPYLAREAGSTARSDGGDADTVSAPAVPAFFPEVTVTFAVEPGQHYHVPLLLSPFGYSVYRGS